MAPTAISFKMPDKGNITPDETRRILTSQYFLSRPRGRPVGSAFIAPAPFVRTLGANNENIPLSSSQPPETSSETATHLPTPPPPKMTTPKTAKQAVTPPAGFGHQIRRSLTHDPLPVQPTPNFRDVTHSPALPTHPAAPAIPVTPKITIPPAAEDKDLPAEPFEPLEPLFDRNGRPATIQLPTLDYKYVRFPVLYNNLHYCIHMAALIIYRANELDPKMRSAPQLSPQVASQPRYALYPRNPGQYQIPPLPSPLDPYNHPLMFRIWNIFIQTCRALERVHGIGKAQTIQRGKLVDRAMLGMGALLRELCFGADKEPTIEAMEKKVRAMDELAERRREEALEALEGRAWSDVEKGSDEGDADGEEADTTSMEAGGDGGKLKRMVRGMKFWKK